MTTQVTVGVSGFLAAPHGMFIGGEQREAASGERFAVIDPASGEELATVPAGDAPDVDAAVAAAREALPLWRARARPPRGAAVGPRQPHRGALRRAGPAQDDRQRQAGGRGPRGGHPAVRGPVSLLRRLGHQDRGRDHPAVGRVGLPRLHPPGAGRRGGGPSSRGTSRCSMCGYKLGPSLASRQHTSCSSRPSKPRCRRCA